MVKQVSDFFAKLIQRVAPKSYQQALGEVYVTRKFLENFSSDQVLVTHCFFFPVIWLHRCVITYIVHCFFFLAIRY